MVDKKRKSRKGKSKKGLKQKQKQKQQVTVNVSSGGGGGGYIPFAPQSAPTFDYSLLANLIRPAATVDVPIMAQQMAPALPSMASIPTLEEELPSRSQKEFGTQTGPMRSAPPTPVKAEDVYRLSKFTPEMRERIAESGAEIALEKPANIRKPVKRVPVEDVSPESIKPGGAVIGGGIFNRPARDKSLRETIPTEPLYEGGGSVRL